MNSVVDPYESLIKDFQSLKSTQKLIFSTKPIDKFESKMSFDLLDNCSKNKIIGTIHKPLKTKPFCQLPAVIFCHGFRGHKFGKKEHYIRLAEELTKKGLVVIRFDFQGSGDSEGDRNYITVSDMKNNADTVMNFVRNLSFVDSQNIGIYGSSFGAHIAIYLAESYPESVRSLALWAPIANGYTLFSDLKKALDNNETVELTKGVLSPGEPVIIANKFICELIKIRDSTKLSLLPPHISVLHTQGEEDNIISAHHRNMFIKEAVDNNRDIRFITFPETGHLQGDSPKYMEIQKELSSYIADSLLIFKHYY
ncbi:MAG: alpha/beta hydrolase [Victivallaceae bacterium]